MEKFIVVIFYKYVKIQNPEDIKEKLFKIAEGTSVKGRIILGEEGINATAGGTIEDIKRFVEELSKIKGFHGIDFKYSDASFNPFNKLKIKIRPEIVTLGNEAKHIDMTKAEPARHISPEELERLYKDEQENLIVIDARNRYEWQVGKFRNSITPEIENFRDIPKFLKKIKNKVKGKKVVFACTSGIRCEKLTAYAKSIGYKGDIYQLEGGMQRYLEKYPSSNFEGALYVFDDRITITYDNSPDRKIISICEYCHEPCDSIKNCFNAKCNKRMIICDDCFKKQQGCCSEECQKIKYPRKVKYRFEEKL
jgi:UPF0176 protein